MILSRPQPGRRRITLVPMIDVLFILLVYFMETSVYLDLDMIPVARKDTMPATALGSGDAQESTRVLMRISSDGSLYLRGQRLDETTRTAALAALATSTPAPQILILPSGAAPLSALTNALDALAFASLTDVRIVRVEGMQ